MSFRRPFFIALLGFSIAGSVFAQREQIRLSNLSGGTRISAIQATDLTLTLTPASMRPVQQIVRTSGALDKTRKNLIASVSAPEADFIKVGQRVRIFSPQAKTSMFQARVTRVTPGKDRAIVEAALPVEGLENTTFYVMEITVERGDFLSIPSEAIIEEGTRRIVYVEKKAGQYSPTEIQTGLQGELLTAIVQGLNEGDRVVTFGSFFIDADHKLKPPDQAPTP